MKKYLPILIPSVLAIINIPLDFQNIVLVDFNLPDYIMKFESRLPF